jgi:hypothetical protein
MRTAARVIAILVAQCAAMSLAQSQTLPDGDEIRALATDLDRHDKNGGCKFIDDFIDRNVRNSDARGLVARFFAFDSLTRRKPFAADSKVRCLYHDRGLAARVAIEQYEAQAAAAVLPPVGFRAEPYLESALGSLWREKLAEAGVRAAAQDVVALHLLCVMKGTNDPGAFWAWMHRTIADGCAAVPPAATFASLKARAAKGPTRTVDALVAEVR